MSADEEIPEIAGFVDLVVIGVGGSATVYSAVQTSMHRKVAVKVVEATGANARRFQREVLALGTMAEIPHVLQVHSVEFTADGRPVLVMPLMPTSLSAVLATNGACDAERVVRWATQLGIAVDEAHRRGVAHRDIKPENVLISSFGDAVLSDFGIATLTDLAAATVTSMSLSPPYAPPERFTGGTEVATAGDVYSLAATLYAALAGRPPFGTTADGGLQGLVNRITNSPPPAIAGVAPEVFAVLEQGLAKSPDQRPASAGALTASLAAAVESAARSAPPDPADRGDALAATQLVETTRPVRSDVATEVPMANVSSATVPRATVSSAASASGRSVSSVLLDWVPWVVFMAGWLVIDLLVVFYGGLVAAVAWVVPPWRHRVPAIEARIRSVLTPLHPSNDGVRGRDGGVRRTRAVRWVLAVALVAAVGLGTWGAARRTYYVGFDRGELVIFQGMRGGVAWLAPTVNERTGITIGELDGAAVLDIGDGKAEPSRDAAVAYVDLLRRSRK